MSNKNQFTIDLGNLELSDTQRSGINAAIQKAVLSEVANYDLSKKQVCISFPCHPIYGIIIHQHPIPPVGETEKGPVNDKI